MNFDSFFDEIETNKITIEFDNKLRSLPAGLNNEALFLLPLLAITILLLSKNRRKPRVEELGQLVGDCFNRTFKGFKGSSQNLGWSANLRVRTISALTFLEGTALVTVDDHKKTIHCSDLGKKIIKEAIVNQSQLSYSLQSIERNYRNIYTEKQLEMELS